MSDKSMIVNQIIDIEKILIGIKGELLSIYQHAEFAFEDGQEKSDVQYNLDVMMDGIQEIVEESVKTDVTSLQFYKDEEVRSLAERREMFSDYQRSIAIC